MAAGFSGGHIACLHYSICINGFFPAVLTKNNRQILLRSGDWVQVELLYKGV